MLYEKTKYYYFIIKIFLYYLLLYEFYFNVDENDNDCIKKGCPVTYNTYIFYLPN